MQDKTGGYCPTCDTVWAAPGRCRCVGIIIFKEMTKEEVMKEFPKDYEKWKNANPE